ncbi:MAG TPA: CocE/NonD family hydrolase [Thermoanaerobaculia bacterium]|nr:CocE/NonD family hydrolase [Thermoanaerobaculia bacterium]
MSRKALLVLLAVLSLAAAPPTPKVSEFNHYSGYSEAVYDGWVRSSRYVTARDGTRLAVDLFRPTRGGKVAEEKLPVVWTHHRYQRETVQEGKTYTILDSFEWLPEVVKHGYVVAAVDVRGSGASFGTFTGMFNLKETQDSYDITEWLAAQPWSNGNVGMYGVSYLGITQYMAAGQKPPHLKAIFPEKAVTDLYDLLWHGGIFHAPFIEFWTRLVHELDVDKPAPPVDEDKDGSLLKAAVQQHRANRDAAKLYAGLPFRDSADPQTGVQVYRDWTPITYLRQIRESKVAVYHLAGWYDRYVRDQTLLFRNLSNPQKLTIGPWTHVQEEHMDFAAEHLRWWDYWLKGIDNHVMDDAPVHYYVMGAPEATAWRAAKTWPLPNERRTSYWLGPGRSLGAAAPQGKGGRDERTVDYSVTVSPDPRWSLERKFPELSAHDAKGLTYTTPPLAAPVEVTGYPVVHLWVSSSAPDADLFVYLEEVDARGSSRYVTEGMLRASDRATADPGYDTAGLPYHRGNKADRANLTPGQPVELVFDLYPTSTLFAAGHRIRVTVTGADKANAVTPKRNPPPKLTVYREPGRASYIELPVIP